MGSDKWVDLRKHYTSKTPLPALIKSLKSTGHQIYTTSLTGGTDIRTFQFPPSGKSVICFGNEETGASEELKSLSDGLFYLPMFGFAESYNLSVATSLACAYLLQKGVIKPRGREEEKRRLLLEWMGKTMDRRGAGRMILEREGVKFIDP